MDDHATIVYRLSSIVRDLPHLPRLIPAQGMHPLGK